MDQPWLKKPPIKWSDPPNYHNPAMSLAENEDEFRKKQTW